MDNSTQENKSYSTEKNHAMQDNKEQKKEKQKEGNKKRLKIMSGIAAAVVVIILSIWIKSVGHESTDNAQLDAMITPVRNIVSGYVTKLKFTDNQHVKKGDTLIVIDRKDYQAKVLQAQAALESAKAQLEIAKSGATSADMNANASVLNSEAAKANIITAQARYDKDDKDFQRIDKMLKDGAVTQQQYDASKAELETSKAQLDMLKKQYQATSAQATGAQSQAEAQKSQIVLSEALVKQREAELQLAKNQLDNTAIIAPFDGIISKKSIEIGQYLQPGAAVCSAIDIANIWVTANFKETQIENMRAGQKAEIKLDAFPKVKVIGKVESFGGATGAKFSLLPPDNATGNFVKITQRVPVRIAIVDYPREMDDMLFPGLSANVDVYTK